MIKNKNIFNVIPLLALLTLSSCSTIKAVHDEQGFTVKVTYNLGEGKFSRNDKDYHELTVYYAPNTPIVDISTLKDYNSIKLDGYTLEGWYFDEALSNKVDFDSYTLGNSAISLFANWKANIRTYFNVYYTDLSNEGNIKLLKEADYSVSKEFTLSKGGIAYPDTSSSYTCVGMYQDEEMTIKVDKNYTLSEENNVKNIYTKWIAGDYKVISTAKDFAKNVGSYNLYIDSDLDFTGVTFIRPKTLVGKTILGNNHKLSNINYTITDTSKNNEVTGLLISDSISDSTIKDLTIENSSFTVSLSICKKFYLGGIAGTINNSSIDNVNILANVTFNETTKTNYAGNLSVKNDCSYQCEGITATNCLINIQTNLED